MSDQKNMLAEDSRSRDIALELASFIVEAPAGAGKTELLTQRYLKLLDTVQSPEEIIAITFTNKAASEMKKRIMDSLAMASTGIAPSQAHKVTTFNLGQKALARSAELGWQLLETPSRLRIYTIDSLSANLARQMPLLSRFGTQPAVAEDASLYYQEAATRTLANLNDAQYTEVIQTALRYFDNDHDRLNKLLAEMLAKRDQWQPYINNNNNAALAEAALAHLVTQDMFTLGAVMTTSIQQALMPIARYAASNLPCEHPIALLRDWETIIPLKPQALPMWHALLELVLTSTGTLRQVVNVNTGFPAVPESVDFKAAHKVIIETLRQTTGAEQALAKLRGLPNPQYDQDSWHMIATLASLLNIAAAELWLVFQTHGEVDFVAISQSALSALGDVEDHPTDLALKLDYKIQHLLVDEFQDTSPTQIKLIEQLTKGWMDGDGRTLFAVGDPMQSIYRFRKANVGLFLRVAQQGIGGLMLTPLKLWRNNRSQAPVVEWINQAFEVVFPAADSVSRGAIAYRQFAATKNDQAGAGVTVHALLDKSANAYDAEEEGDAEESDVRQLEANKIIQIIKETRAQDENKKIAVLVRARAHLHALVAEIRRNHPDLEFQAVEIEELANRQVVQDLLTLTNALHQRADRVHWLALLRAPWCGLSLADLHALVGQDEFNTVLSLMHNETRLQALSDDGRKRLLHVRAVIDEALLHRGRMSISRWVQGVWLMLGGASCLWNAGDVRDVQAFFDRIDRMETNGQFTTEMLAQEVKKLYAAPDAKATDKLQFMTIHKSKGLEFDTVILPGLDKATGGNDQPLLLWEEVSKEEAGMDAADVDLVVAPFRPKSKVKKALPTPYDYLKSLEKERADYEDARVLYVAVTRAERCLHLLGAVSLDKDGETKPKKNTFLEMLWPVLAEQFKPENLQAEKLDASASSGNQPSLNIATFVPQLLRLEVTEIPQALRADIVLNTQPSTQNEAESLIVPVLEADIGILAHRYLELIAKTNRPWPLSRLESLMPAMQRHFVQQGHITSRANEGAERVIELLTRTLQSETGLWLLQARETAQSELEVEFIEGETFKKRVIDRTFIEDGTRWIVDYKTTSTVANSSEAELEVEALKHVPQLAEYAALFKDEGLAIKTAVFFVSIGRLIEVSV